MSGCGCGDKMNRSSNSSDTIDPNEFLTLLEKGRRKALDMLRHNPAARERVIKTFGLDYFKARYPELYGINKPPVYDEPSGRPPVPMTL